MGQNHIGRHLLKLLGVWQLGLVLAHVHAPKTAVQGHDAAADLLSRPLLANMFPMELQTSIFQTREEQCPRPGPCYRSAQNEFCVFSTNAIDEQGLLKVVPLVTSQARALQLMEILSKAVDSRRERSAKLKYNVSPVPGKGLGILSTGRLERGDHIMSDLPTLIIDHCMMATVPQYHLARLMNEAANRLFITQLDRVVNLDVFGAEAPDEHYLIGRIYATSAYMLDPDGVLFGSGCGIGALFPEVSRMNHDCRPNAAYHFNPKTAMMEVHAVRSIAAGEEITVSYISPFIPHAHRQALLYDRWGFKCHCAACSAPAAAVNTSDTRLEKISSLWPLLLDKMEDGVPNVTETITNEAIDLAGLLVSSAEAERLDAVMLQPYRTAALEWNALGEREKAIHYAKLAAEYGINSFGHMNSMVRDMQDLIQDPESHWSWELRIIAKSCT